MVKFHPLVLARLREVLEFLDGTPFASSKDELRNLRKITASDDERPTISDDDIDAFRSDFERLKKLLQIESRNASAPLRSGAGAIPLTKNGSHPSAAANGKDPSRVYAMSGTLQGTQFSTNDATLLIEIITVLPTVRAETGDNQLRTIDLLQALAGAKKIPPPGPQLINAAIAHDSHNVNVTSQQSFGYEMERPEEAVNYVITHLPQIVEMGLLEKFVRGNILPRVQRQRVALYRTAAAYDTAFRLLPTIDREKVRDPQKLIEELEKLARSTAEKYLGIVIQPATLFRAWASMNGITAPNAYWNILDSKALYFQSRILMEFRSKDGIDRPETLLPHLITLLPLIREETRLEELTLRDCLFALAEGGILLPPHSRYFEAAAVYDLHDHKMLRALPPEVLSTPRKLFDVLIHLRPDVPGYENAPIMFFIEALLLMRSLTEEKKRHYIAQATIYDRAFEKAEEIVAGMNDDETPVTVVQRLAAMAQEVLETYNRGDTETDISVLSIVKHLSLNSMLHGLIEQYLVAAAAADMSLASKLFDETTVRTEERTGGVAIETPDLDRFARSARPFMKLAAAQDFASLFEREVRDEDKQTPETLIDKLVSIRTTLEGYEYEPITTFVRALVEAGKLEDDNRAAYLRYAAAHDLWGERLRYLDDDDLGSPERLIAKIVSIRQDIPGYEHEPLTTFIEALAVLGKIPDDLDAYTGTASLYDAMLPPDKKDPSGGLPPAGQASGGDMTPAAPAGGGGPNRASPQDVSAAFFAGTLFRAPAPQMPLMPLMTPFLPVSAGLSGIYLRT